MKGIIAHYLPNYIKEKYTNRDQRTKEAFKQSIISLIVKGVTVLCSLILIPLTINYVNPTRYGIWLTLSGVIGWVHFFDLGLGNGFRNKYAESKAKGNLKLANEYISTSYFCISCIVLIVFIISMIANFFVDWSSILNVDKSYHDELRKVFSVVLIFVCLHMVFSLINTLLTADQKIGYTSLIGGAGQVLSVIVIFILTKISTGSLLNLALYYSGIPTLVVIMVSLYLYSWGRYKENKPSFSRIRFSLIKNIMGLGVNFFIIYICLILVFQLVNIALSREAGPEAVTQYNVAFKYFNVLYMVMTIIVSPYWSAFTDAYTKGDYSWMKSTLRLLEKILFISVISSIIMLCLSSLFYKIWMGDSVEIEFTLSLALMMMTIASNFGIVYMSIINGIGTIRIQLIIYLLFAFSSWPLLVLTVRYGGVPAVVIMPTMCYFIQAIFGRIQIKKLLAGTANGIWLK